MQWLDKTKLKEDFKVSIYLGQNKQQLIANDTSFMVKATQAFTYYLIIILNMFLSSIMFANQWLKVYGFQDMRERGS